MFSKLFWLLSHGKDVAQTASKFADLLRRVEADEPKIQALLKDLKDWETEALWFAKVHFVQLSGYYVRAKDIVLEIEGKKNGG